MSEKHDGWEEVKFEADDPSPVTVTMLTTRTEAGKLFGGDSRCLPGGVWPSFSAWKTASDAQWSHLQLFGAGRVYVTLFGTEVRCVALRAGDEKYVIQPEHGPAWLVERGLDRQTAEQLVNDAMIQPEE